MRGVLEPVFSKRFLKFCAVGGSGVLVNLGCLALFARVLGWHANLSAALAILASINTNFLVNEKWTFRDLRSGSKGRLGRWAKFHVVTSVGAAVQWLVFIFLNLLIARLLGVETTGARGGVLAPFLDPPEVGNWIFASQLAGIAAATFWNYMASFYWTWRRLD
jgi:dolichol-phosphate mannosyltransferase